MEAAYTRARELCERVGEPPQLFRCCGDCGDLTLARAESRDAGVGEQLLSLAQRCQDPAFLCRPTIALGATLFWRESWPRPAHLEQGLRLYEPQRHRAHRRAL